MPSSRCINKYYDDDNSGRDYDVMVKKEARKVFISWLAYSVSEAVYTHKGVFRRYVHVVRRNFL